MVLCYYKCPQNSLKHQKLGIQKKLWITTCDRSVDYKVWQNGLQSASGITKCVKVDYKVWWDYKVSVQWSRFLSIRRGCNLSIHQMCTFTNSTTTAQKMKFSIKDFFRKCDQIRRNLGKTSFFVQFTATILLYWIWTPPQS